MALISNWTWPISSEGAPKSVSTQLAALAAQKLKKRGILNYISQNLKFSDFFLKNLKYTTLEGGELMKFHKSNTAKQP